MNQHLSLAQMVKAAQQGVLNQLGRGAPPAAQEKVASDDYVTKLASVSRAFAAALIKNAEDNSPGVSQAITPPGLPEDLGHSNAKPGLGRSSLTAKPEPGAAPASLETSHAIGNKTAEEEGAEKKKPLAERLSDFAKKHPYQASAIVDGSIGAAIGLAAGGPQLAIGSGAMRGASGVLGAALGKSGHPVLGILGTVPGALIGHHARKAEEESKQASAGGGALPESNASQPAGHPIGGKPKGPTHLVASNQAAINATSKDTYAPREKDMKGLISQPMNGNDKALQVAFKNHDGAKTAGFANTLRSAAGVKVASTANLLRAAANVKVASEQPKGPSDADLSVKTASAAEVLRRLEAQVS